MKDYWIEEKHEKKVSKKKIIISVIVMILIILFIVLAVIYVRNKSVRDWMDTVILRKEVVQDKVSTIELKEGETNNIFAFHKYIGVLNKNKFDIYGNTGNKEKTLDIQISNPMFTAANRFLVVAEKKGQKFYVVADKDISWEGTVEGNIAQVYINKNGYVAVVIVDTGHKTVISVYNPQGKPLFKQFLSRTRAADVAISNDNKYLAIAEVDTSGTMIQSSVKMISVEKASSDEGDSMENTYTMENDKLITNIKYHDKGKLVCMFSDGISIIENNENKELVNSKDKKVMFQAITLNNNIVTVEEKSSGLFTADSIVNIMNIENRNVKEYFVDSVTKEIYTFENIIALNLGTEIEFISNEGWLVKRYMANQEITNVVVSNNIAGVIYRDKIEIVNL